MSSPWSAPYGQRATQSRHNVGFMPSDAFDVSSMTPVEVDAVSDDETAVEIEDLYAVKATRAHERNQHGGAVVDRVEAYRPVRETHHAAATR